MGNFFLHVIFLFCKQQKGLIAHLELSENVDLFSGLKLNKQTRNMIDCGSDLSVPISTSLN